jgi:hypothetical protein
VHYNPNPIGSPIILLSKKTVGWKIMLKIANWRLLKAFDQGNGTWLVMWFRKGSFRAEWKPWLNGAKEKFERQLLFLRLLAFLSYYIISSGSLVFPFWVGNVRVLHDLLFLISLCIHFLGKCISENFKHNLDSHEICQSQAEFGIFF